VQPGDAIGLRRSTGRVVGLEAQVTVIAVGRDERDVTGGSPSRHATRLQYDVEAQHVHVEGTYTIDVGRAQMHVADGDVRVDRVWSERGRNNGALRLRAL
jgi:hypothetical protein